MTIDPVDGSADDGVIQFFDATRGELIRQRTRGAAGESDQHNSCGDPIQTMCRRCAFATELSPHDRLQIIIPRSGRRHPRRLPNRDDVRIVMQNLDRRVAHRFDRSHAMLARHNTSAGCDAVRPVPSKIWCRHDVPVATMIVSSGADRTAGNKTNSPICMDKS